MPAGRRGYPGLPAMRNDLRAKQFAKIGDAPDLRQSTTTADIGLNNADFANGQPFANLKAGCSRLGATNANRTSTGKLRMAQEIVMLQCCLGKEDVVICNPLKDVQRVVPIVPAVAKIDCHQNVIAERAAALANEADEFGIGDEIVEQYLHLHRPKANLDGGLELTIYLRHQLINAAALGKTWKDRAIGFEFFAPGAAHDLVGGQTELLSGQVVQRDIYR